MKSVYLFFEDDCCYRRLKGVYASKELASKDIDKYLNCLEQDAIEHLGGLRLDAELLRIQVIRESLEIFFGGKDDYLYSNYSDHGITILKKALVENEEDLTKDKDMEVLNFGF